MSDSGLVEPVAVGPGEDGAPTVNGAATASDGAAGGATQSPVAVPAPSDPADASLLALVDRLTLFQGPEAVATDCGVVHEHVAATLALNETVALGVVEPLDLACNAHRSSS